MSGGSFDYLYSEQHLPAYQVEAMAVYLSEQCLHAAAFRTRQCLEHLNSAKAIQEELADVWKAAEWHCSGDWGLDALQLQNSEWATRHRADIEYKAMLLQCTNNMEKSVQELRAALARVLPAEEIETDEAV